MTSQRLRFFGPLLTALVSVVLAVVASEGIARLLLDPPRYHREPVQFDPALGFRGIPDLSYPFRTREGRHEVSFNEDGLRGRALPSGPADAGVQRIAFLGDSFLVGEAVPESELLTARVEEVLRAGDDAAEVYNLSAIDWGTAQQLLFLEQISDSLAPDTVVLAFYVGNDVANNSLALAGVTATSPGDPIRPYRVEEGAAARIEYLDPRRAWLRRSSRIFALFERRYRPPVLGEVPAESRMARLATGRLPIEELELFRRHPEGHRWEIAWQDSFSLIRAVKRHCDEIGARLIVMVLPSAHQVQQTADAVRFGAETRGFGKRPLSSLVDWNAPEGRLVRFFEEAGIESVLILPALRSAARESRSPYAIDGHLSSEGHAVAADAVVEALRSGAAAPVAPEGAPVPWDAAPLPVLDFTMEPHDSRLGAGWLGWRRAEDGRPGGWAIGPAAMVALDPGEDRAPIVLRGHVDERASFPVSLVVHPVGALAESHDIHAPGPFEHRFEISGRAALSESGHMAVIIASSRPAGVRIEAVGFVPE